MSIPPCGQGRDNSSPKLVYDVQDLIASGLFSPASFYRAANAGKIRALKQGKRTIVLASELERYLDSLPAAQFRARAA